MFCVWNIYRCTANIYMYIPYSSVSFSFMFIFLCGASVYGPHIMLFMGKACDQSFILYCDLFKLALRVFICQMQHEFMAQETLFFLLSDSVICRLLRILRLHVNLRLGYTRARMHAHMHACTHTLCNSLWVKSILLLGSRQLEQSPFSHLSPLSNFHLTETTVKNPSVVFSYLLSCAICCLVEPLCDLQLFPV